MTVQDKFDSSFWRGKKERKLSPIKKHHEVLIKKYDLPPKELSIACLLLQGNDLLFFSSFKKILIIFLLIVSNFCSKSRGSYQTTHKQISEFVQ